MQRSVSLESDPYGRAFGKHARATCGEGASTRDTSVEAKDTSDYLNRELCNHLKLNWTYGTCAKIFMRLLVSASACRADPEENEQCSPSACQDSMGMEVGQGSSTPLHKESTGLGLLASPATNLWFIQYWLPSIYTGFLSCLALIPETLHTSFRSGISTCGYFLFHKLLSTASLNGLLTAKYCIWMEVEIYTLVGPGQKEAAKQQICHQISLRKKQNNKEYAVY